MSNEVDYNVRIFGEKAELISLAEKLQAIPAEDGVFYQLDGEATVKVLRVRPEKVRYFELGLGFDDRGTESASRWLQRLSNQRPGLVVTAMLSDYLAGYKAMLVYSGGELVVEQDWPWDPLGEEDGSHEPTEV